MNRNVWATIVATVAVVAVIILGFRFLGGPGTQRMVQWDLRRVRILAELARQINERWRSSGKGMPIDLQGFTDSAKKDPVTGKPFVYHPKPENKYELCATFDTDDREIQNTGEDAHWTHPKGDFCFDLDATQPVPPAPYYY